MNYLVHNGSRDRRQRFTRASLPTHGGHKQYVMGNQRRLVPNRPLYLDEEQLKAYLAELIMKQNSGLLYVTTSDGRSVDLSTLSVGEAPVHESPRPIPPLDLVARDKPHGGLPLSQFRQEPPPPAEFTMPVDPPPAAVDFPLSEDPVLGGVVIETPPAHRAPRKRGER